MLIRLRLAGLFDPAEFFLPDLIQIKSLPVKVGSVSMLVGRRPDKVGHFCLLSDLTSDEIAYFVERWLLRMQL